MKFFYTFFVILTACSSLPPKPQASEFKDFWNGVGARSLLNEPSDPNRLRLENANLIFEGSIIAGDCDRIEKILNKISVSTLVVNSQGGDVDEALCIAKRLRLSEIRKTVVRGLCWSSCANYLFLGAQEKIIERGVVGFHGNFEALVESVGATSALEKNDSQKLRPDEVKKFRKIFGSKELSKTLTEFEQKIFDKFRKTIKKEKDFLSDHQLPQSFFELTQRADKGENNGKAYPFLAPSARYLSHVGIKVAGDQDVQFIEALFQKTGVELLYKP